jgi:hypothetical protein
MIKQLDTSSVMKILFTFFPFISSVEKMRSLSALSLVNSSNRFYTNTAIDIPGDVKSHIKTNQVAVIQTVQIVSHKLMANWRSVVPISWESFRRTEIYNDDVVHGPGHGLWDGDYYNVLVNDLYWRALPAQHLIRGELSRKDLESFASKNAIAARF